MQFGDRSTFITYIHITNSGVVLLFLPELYNVLYFPMSKGPRPILEENQPALVHCRLANIRGQRLTHLRSENRGKVGKKLAQDTHLAKRPATVYSSVYTLSKDACNNA